MMLIPGLSFWTVYHALYGKLWTAQAVATMPKQCHGELHSVFLGLTFGIFEIIVTVNFHIGNISILFIHHYSQFRSL